MKPATPILRNEHYLDVMTGGSASLPSPILREERYLAKLAGMEVNIPSPVTIKEKYYAKICGMDVDVPTYTRNMPRIYAYMAKAAGQTIEDLPTAVTREQRYWYDYVSEPPVTEHEYTGAVPYTFTANGEPLLDYLISGNMVQNGTASPTTPIQPPETGDLETSGDKTGQYKIPISSANTTTPVYLGEVETTRRIRKLVLTGDINEDWKAHQIISSWYQLSITDIIIENLEMCTHYKASPNTPADIQNNEILVVKQYQSIYGRIIIKGTNCATVEDFKAYLAQQYAAGTPVTIWYVLATPETAVVNEPIRKIGDYADTLSMEQAGVSIPTNNGSTTVDVETTLKPSEVYIKYKGV